MRDVVTVGNISAPVYFGAISEGSGITYFPIFSGFHLDFSLSLLPSGSAVVCARIDGEQISAPQLVTGYGVLPTPRNHLSLSHVFSVFA